MPRSAVSPRHGCRTSPGHRDLQRTDTGTARQLHWQTPHVSSAAGDWRVEVVRGSASDFHARALPTDGARHLWWFEVDRPALVLGSTQNDSLVDADACAQRGVEVVRRHSGGGAVLLTPGEVVWFDLLVPRHDPLWDDDLGRSAHWVGTTVATALTRRESAGSADLAVHRGGVVTTRWSPTVCFAGIGPGELLDMREGAGVAPKVLGVSQRRTRTTARFQCALYRVWRPELLVELLAEPRPPVGELHDLVATADLGLESLLAALPR